MTDELALLRAADPVPAGGNRLPDQPLDARAARELRELVSGGPVWRRPARWAVAVAGVVAVAALGITLGLPGGGTAPAHAATPPLLELTEPAVDDAAPLLGDLATAAESSSGGPAERGATWRSWSLWTVAGDAGAASAVVPQENALVWRPDGSGALEVTAGTPYFPSQAHRKAWTAQGQPVPGDGEERRTTFAPGEFAPVFEDPPPTDPAALRSYLAESHPIDEHGAAELFVAVEGLSREWRLGPAERAAVLRLVAGTEEVMALGPTTDRLGRPGEALAVDSDMSGLPTRYVLVIDPQDGRLLAAEQWLTSDAGALDVPVPSVVSYAVWP